MVVSFLVSSTIASSFVLQIKITLVITVTLYVEIAKHVSISLELFKTDFVRLNEGQRG